MFEYLLDWILAKQTRRRISKRRINPNEQCFACGHKDGQIAFDPGSRFVMHRCNICGAVRAMRPILPAPQWDFVGRDAEVARKYEEEMRQRFDVAGQIGRPKQDKAAVN